MPDDRGSFINDRCKLSGRKPVIDIVCNPGLQVACGDPAEFSAAIDKGFLHPANFGDVGMDGNPGVIGKNKSEFGFRVLIEDVFEFGCFHIFYSWVPIS